ncbi:MAG: hypothetical protein AM326_04580 [Candidatus Thorarchaeota archaeon SMTZ-45]|nr:MAG: hypothetical protein AM326_04580 [Candidatus Thorarchaeota archaeon SMTZ-45]KXH74875.1 MAG: hypothetical protein AM325_11785 [Candidatus Thorarchaeota archaeon SMTZ1-45]
MTKPEPADIIVPRILKQYSERPRGWHIMSSPRGEMLILSSDSAFQLKLIPLNPYEFTGAGVELPESCDTVESIRASPEFGLRPLSESDLQGILNSITGDAGPKLSLNDILKRTPHSIDDISADIPSPVLRGPVLVRPELGSLSPEILRRQMSLDRSAEKTFRKRYPERAGMYF